MLRDHNPGGEISAIATEASPEFMVSLMRALGKSIEGSLAYRLSMD